MMGTPKATPIYRGRDEDLHLISNVLLRRALLVMTILGTAVPLMIVILCDALVVALREGLREFRFIFAQSLRYQLSHVRRLIVAAWMGRPRG